MQFGLGLEKNVLFNPDATSADWVYKVILLRDWTVSEPI